MLKYKNSSIKYMKNIIAPIFISMFLIISGGLIGYIENPMAEGEEPLTIVDDDCETSEVIITDITSPPKNAPTGLYDVTAEFSSVGIIINGKYDITENEPWIEHEESPDINGTPGVKFYTSCDENYMYLAFENLSDGIIAGEIFIDVNNDNIWDESDGDILLTFVYDESMVRNNYGLTIKNSKVAWGSYKTFIEIKIPKNGIWESCNKWAFRVRNLECDGNSRDLIDIPIDPVTMHAVHSYDDSYFKTTLTDVPSGYDVENKTYLGWCIERQYAMNETPWPIYLISSYPPPEHGDLVNENWSKVNYIINHKLSNNYDDIQKAIWYFINIGDAPSPEPTPLAWDMINESNKYGESFIPSQGQNISIVCDPIIRPPGCQYTIIEVEIPEINCSWNPSWGNNSHPSDTPPDFEFLNFTCEYGLFNCPCGVAFKALADMYRIQPGECYTLYETDFENDSKNLNEWIAKSLDGTNSDTWNISTNRSTSQTYHCTDHSEYYGNAYDVLEMKNYLDLSEALNVTFSFDHWCEGDSYQYNGSTIIADYGEVQFYTYINDTWKWINLSDLSISNIYYDNGWIRSSIHLDKSKNYSYAGSNITGEQLLTDQNKFRFAWISDPQFQYEGWYVDNINITICVNEWINETVIWQSQSEQPYHWCIQFNATVQMTFPLQWNASKFGEGKYLLRVCIQEEPPWCGEYCYEKTIVVGDIHDVAVIDVDPSLIVEPGTDVNMSGTIKNVGTYDETNIQVKATLKKDGTGSPIWQDTQTIPFLNVSEEKTLYYTWEDAEYCRYQLEVTAILPEDEVPSNNTMDKWIIVASTIFEDDMEADCCWEHIDLTGGIGHWVICSSGYDQYLWCGNLETTKYEDNWNDVAEINKTFNLSNYDSIFLNFSTFCEIDKNDIGYVEITDDNGQHWYIEKQFTGHLNWTDISIDISKYNTSKVRIRFRFYSNESITWRGWIIDDVTLEADGTQLFNDEFNNDTGNWTIERQRGLNWWHLVEKAKSGDIDNKAFWCGDYLTGKYPANIENVLRLIDGIQLTKAFAAYVEFTTWYDIEPGDLGTIEISDDNGASWDILDSFVNNSDGWTSYVYDISTYIGNEILLQFKFTSDDDTEREGWYVDDVKIVAKLDNDPPVTAISLSGTTGLNDWYTSSVQVSLNANDGTQGSGVKQTYYRLDSGSQSTYTSPFTVSTQGVHTIDYWSVDNVNNIENTKTETFKIDSIAPSVEITKPDFGIYWRDRKIWPIISFTVLNWTKPIILRQITITADASDSTPGSGLDRVEFYVDGTLKGIASSPPYIWIWDERVFFNHGIEVRAFDNAGLSSSSNKAVWIINFNFLGGN